MAEEFAGKTVLVTGATSGIGRGIAVAFAAAGAVVFGLGRRAAEGEETRRLIAATGGQFTFIPTDISRKSDVDAAVAAVVERRGKLDCAANAAGLDINGSFVDLGAEDYQRVFDVNVKGLFLCLSAEVQAMRRGGGGAIVNIGSIAGQRALAGNSLYNASKSAANMLMRSAAVDCGRYGIRINEVAPGPVMTPMLSSYLEKAAATGFGPANLEAMTPLGGMSEPSDIAAAVLFLCSARAARITGATLAVDGGFVLG